MMDNVAAVPAAIANFGSVVINPLLRLFLALGFVFFLWGLVEFLMNRGDASKSQDGKRHMVWGLVGLAIIVGVFGVINLITGFLSSLGVF